MDFHSYLDNEIEKLKREISVIVNDGSQLDLELHEAINSMFESKWTQISYIIWLKRINFKIWKKRIFSDFIIHKSKQSLKWALNSARMLRNQAQIKLYDIDKFNAHKTNCNCYTCHFKQYSIHGIQTLQIIRSN